MPAVAEPRSFMEARLCLRLGVCPVDRAKGEGPGLSGLEVSLREKPPPERGERGDSVLTVVGRVVAAAEFVEQVCPVGCHQ